MVIFEGYIIAIENEYMSRISLMQHLQNNEAAYIFLLENGYLKSNSSQQLSFCYVGIVSFSDIVLCILPKYYRLCDCSSKEVISDFTKVIKTLKRVQLSYEIPDQSLLLPNKHAKFNEITAADKFLKDYLDYGIYRKSESIYALNADGEVSWDTSINQLYPMFSKRQPIYYDVYSQINVTEDDNIITELHKWIIKRFLNKYGLILDYTFSFTESTVSDLSKLGTNEYLKTVVRNQLNVAYVDREILLLKGILSLLNAHDSSDKNQFTLYGTGYFHVVWEVVCGEVLRNKFAKFSTLIPEPHWHDMLGNSIAKDTLRPDIISTVEVDVKRFFIFDAKYYSLCYTLTDELEVSGNPGIQDVSKQYLYALSYKDVNYTKMYNCFLFPKLGTSFFEVVGFVSFNLFNEAKVYNVYISPDLLFKKYLSSDHVSVDELNRLSFTFDKISESDEKRW